MPLDMHDVSPTPSRRKEWLLAALLTVIGAATIVIYIIMLRGFPVFVLFLLVASEIFILILVYFILVGKWRQRDDP
ncbi:MAG: hypothetical protein ABSH19_05400 [Opitutales bacterium]|jgi:hypothetical protein